MKFAPYLAASVGGKFQLPPHAMVHPVFHVSLLRRARSAGMSVEPQLPHCSDDLAVPIAVLQTRWRKQKDGVREQVKIQWSSSATLGTTWEDKESLMARFPHAEAWDQASSQREGGVNAPDKQDPQGSDSFNNRAVQRPTWVRRLSPRTSGPDWTH